MESKRSENAVCNVMENIDGQKRKITSKILEKIRALTQSQVSSETMPKQKIEIHSAKQNNDDFDRQKLNVWLVYPRIYVLGRCWKNRTEMFNKFNNIDDATRYLAEKFDKRYMLWTCNKLFESSKNVQFIPDLRLDMSLAYNISRAVGCWLEIDSSHVVVLELKHTQEEVVAFLLSCILRYCRFYHTALSASEIVVANKWISPINSKGTFQRYVKYFDDLYNIKKDLLPQLILHQLIITTVPSITKLEYFPSLRVSASGITARKLCDDRHIYHDDNYIIFSDIDLKIAKDIKITLYFIVNKQEIPILNLLICPLFYRQGLYRFYINDIECLHNRELFNSDFSVDLVLKSSDEEINNPFNITTNLIEDMDALLKNLKNEYSSKVMNALLKKRYDVVLAKFCASMGYEIEEAESLLGLLVERGHKNLKVPSIKESSEDKVASSDVKESQVKLGHIKTYQELDRQKFYKNFKHQEIKEVSIVKESYETTLVPSLKAKKLVPKRKIFLQDQKIPEVIVKKPLHWIPLTKTEETIFEELNKIDTEIDYRKFEEMFCEPLQLEKVPLHVSKEAAVLTDTKRVFLVSLSLRHLEMKNIVPCNLKEIIETKPDALRLQDLLNIERVFPTSTEIEALLSADMNTISTVEVMMLKFAELQHVSVLVQILIFERRFFEEIFSLQDNLNDLINLFNSILDSNNLRVIIKTILEIGNAVNFKYSARKKRISGFKLSSLYVFNTYKGKNNSSLFTFLIDTLNKGKQDVSNVYDELILVHKLKNEELGQIREKLNAFIISFKENLILLDKLNKDQHEIYKKFFAFASYKLDELCQKFKECSVHASMVKRKFGEDETKTIGEILVILSDFLNNLKTHTLTYRT